MNSGMEMAWIAIAGTPAAATAAQGAGATTSAAGTTRLTSPITNASSARTGRPVSNTSRARLQPRRARSASWAATSISTRFFDASRVRSSRLETISVRRASP